MAGKTWGAVAIVLGLAVFLAGCAEAPLPPAAATPQAPLPQARRSPQEVALERALGEFYGAPYRAGGTTPEGVDCS
ncbi:MAG: glycoside hydrolase, partial [Desulfobaccales bacterium]